MTKRPTDPNQLAKYIVDQATGERPKEGPLVVRQKNPAAVALGRKGGKKGAEARKLKLTKERRSQIARKAALARWSKA